MIMRVPAAAFLMMPLVGLAQTAPVPPGPAAAAASAAGRSAAEPMPALRSSTELGPLPRNEAARALPIVLRARRLSGQLDQQALAEGDVEFRRGGVVIRADELSYDSSSDIAKARGNVRISRDGAVYSGPALSLGVQSFEGSFTEPTFEFQQLGAGGRAQRLDFLGPSKALAIDARYTSCRPGDDEAGRLQSSSEMRGQRIRVDVEELACARDADTRHHGHITLGAALRLPGFVPAKAG